MIARCNCFPHCQWKSRSLQLSYDGRISHVWMCHAGDDIFNDFQDTITSFIEQARPFFPKGSAVDIYSMLNKKLKHTEGNDCYEALGWLAYFLPTSELKDETVPWNSWVEEWLSLAEANSSCDFWNKWWLKLFARIVKNDKNGIWIGCLTLSSAREHLRLSCRKLRGLIGGAQDKLTGKNTLTDCL